MAHISLDVWNTLFIPNPQYATWRTQWLAERLGIDTALAKSIYTSVKTCVDNDAEEMGIGYSTDGVYSLLSEEFAFCMKIDLSRIEQMLDGIRPKFEQKFRELAPTIPNATIRTIQAAQQNGHTFSIASNTNFITGHVIREYLSSQGLDFSFYVFSDLTNEMAKPNRGFFHLVKQSFSTTFPGRTDTITHIGDNPICDDPKGMMAHVIIAGPHDLAFAIEGVL